jgi:hypothetical protein
VFLEKQKYSSRYIISIVVGSYHDLSCKNLQLELTRLLAMMISFQMNNEDHFVTWLSLDCRVTVGLPIVAKRSQLIEYE